jgi:uncharacterized protein YkwD
MSNLTAQRIAPARSDTGEHARNVPKPTIESVVVLVLALAIQAAMPAETATAASVKELRMHALVNEARAARGLPGLTLSDPLSSVARAHSATMAEQRRLFHTDCLTCVVSVSVWQLMGENVGAGRPVGAVHRAFMRSAGHRANILNPEYGRVGIGVARGGRRLWVTEIFVG